MDGKNVNLSLICVFVFLLFFNTNTSSQILSTSLFDSSNDQNSLVTEGGTPSDAQWYEYTTPTSHKHWTFTGGEAKVVKENAAPGEIVNAWLISPQITLYAGGNVLTYTQTQKAETTTTTYKVMISTTTRDAYSFSLLYSYTGALSEFNASESVDLSDFSGETVYIAFVRVLPDIKGQDWKLDNIQITGSDVLEVSSFTISSVLDNSVSMYWSKNANSDDVIVAYSADGTFGDPIDGTAYAADDAIAGGGTVLYVGSSVFDEASPFTHSSLTEFTPYYYKIWSVDGSNNYSYSGLEEDVITTGAETILYADFENETGDNVWTKEATAWSANQNHQWYIGGATFYRGSQAAYITTNDNGSFGLTATYRAENHNPIYLYRDITIPAGTYKSVELSFFWKAGGNEGSDYGEVHIGSKGNLLSAAQEFQGSNGWVEKTYDLTDELDLVAGGTYTIYFMWDATWAVSANNPGFCVDDVRVTGRTVERPTNFTASVSGTNDVSLVWDAPNPSNDVLVAYSSTGAFGDPLIGDPVKGTSYSVGDYLPGGGQVVYKNSTENYTHENVSSGVAYYKAWTISAGNTYSVGVSSSTSMPVTLPFSEDFEGDVSSWSLGNNQYHDWVVGRAQKNGGVKSAYVSTDNGISASYSLSSHNASVDLILPINLKGFKSAQLDFKWLCHGLQYNEYGLVLLDGSDPDGNNTHYEVQGSTWQDASITITPSLLGNVSELRFRMRKNYQTSGTYPGFCIDDVSITGAINDVSAFSAVNGNTNANDLSWTGAAGLDEVIIIAEELSSGTVSATLTNGTTYNEGDIISGGTIIYIGTETSYAHSSLKLNTRYAYKIWHKSGLTYSDNGTTLTAEATTPDNVGFYEDFESGGMYSWTLTTDGSNDFIIGNPSDQNPFGGSSMMFVSESAGSTATYQKNSGTVIFELSGEQVDLTGFNSASLIFYSLIGGVNNKDYGIVKISGTGLPETTLASNINNHASWTKQTISLDSYIANSPLTLKFEFYSSNNSASDPGWCIDNIAIVGSFDNNSTLTNPADVSGRASELSSLSVSEAGAEMFMDFIITDAGSPGDGKSTVVNGITFLLDGTSTITDLTEVVSGAYIKQAGGATLGYGNIYSTSIVFEQEDLISVSNGTAETYELYVYLKNPMDINGDKKTIKLNLTVDDLVAYNGSGFGGASETITNTATIDVDISELNFSTEPSVYNVLNDVLITTPVVYGVDANGNLDLDYTGTVDLNNDGVLTSSGDQVTAVAGVADFSSYTITQSGGPVAITATDGTYTGTFQSVYVSSYCSPVMTSNTDYISLVNFNEIDSYSSAEGVNVVYNLDQSTNLTRAKTYTLTIGVNATSGAEIVAWIDFDQDQTFANGTFTEKYTLGTATGGAENLNLDITIPASAELGGTRMRIMVRETNGLSACANDNNGETEDYTLIITNNQWLGNSPTWDVGSNWSSGVVPASNTDVTIPSSLEGSFYPIVTSDLIIDNLEIQTGGRLTINEGVHVTVTDMVNDGLLILKSRYDNMSSFIATSESGTGEVQTVMYFPANRYWYTGHAVSNITSLSYDPESSGSKVYQYTNAWNGITNNSTSFTEPLRGYAVKFTTPTSVVFQGPLNSGDYVISGLSSGWHLLANPYPSYVNLGFDDDNASNFTITNVPKYVYTRTTIGSERVAVVWDIESSLSSHVDASQYVAPMQAFWIYSGGSGVFEIKNSARCHDSGSFKSAKIKPDEVLRFTLTNKYTRDYAAITFNEAGNNNLTSEDAAKASESNGRVPQLYTYKDGKKVVINKMPELFESTQVDLYQKVGKEGLVETTLELLNPRVFDPEMSILLEDLVTGDIVDLRDNPKYKYTPVTTSNTNRFSIYLDKALTTSIDKKPGLNVQIMTIESNLIINCKNFSNQVKKVVMYTLEGKKVFEGEFVGGVYKKETNVSTGIYLVKLILKEGQVTQKVYINK